MQVFFTPSLVEIHQTVVFNEKSHLRCSQPLSPTCASEENIFFKNFRDIDTKMPHTKFGLNIHAIHEKIFNVHCQFFLHKIMNTVIDVLIYGDKKPF